MTQNTEQNVRTREEQIADLVEALSDEVWVPDHKSYCEKMILEAEARGAEEQRRKDAALTRAQHFLRGQAEAQDRLPERDDIKKWQEDQSEFFTATILEIVCEYAAWRDKKDAEGQEPVAWQWLDAKSGWLQVIHDDPAAHAKEMEEMGIACRPVYLGPAKVAALEAEIASLKEAVQLARAENFHQRTQILELRNDDRRIRLAAERVCSVREGSEIFEARIALRAALTREGGA